MLALSEAAQSQKGYTGNLDHGHAFAAAAPSQQGAESCFAAASEN